MKTLSRTTWGKMFGECWLCGSRDMLTTHEMVRGPNRAKALVEPCCWFRVDQNCHGDLDNMPIARQLAIKLFHDPENYDRQRVNELRRRAPDAVSEAEVDAEYQKLFGEET